MTRASIQRPPRLRAGLDWGLIAPVVLLDLGARLAAPGAVLALARSQADMAVVSAAVVTGLAGLRALVVGRVQAASVRHLWGALIDATRRRSVSQLRTKEDEHGSAALLEAVGQVAHVRSGVVTRLVADALALVAVLVATVVLVGVTWLALGAVALALGGGIVMAAHRRMRTADIRAYEHFVSAAHDFQVLADAAVELRAHSREETHASALAAEVDRMTGELRRGATYSALAGLFPFGVVLLVAAAPLGFELTAIVSLLGGTIVDVGILGASGLMFAFGLARSVESWARSAPQRSVLASFIDGTPRAPAQEATTKVALRDTTIELRDVGVVYPGADRMTPAGVSLSWPPRTGLALVGPNGAGKSTLAMCVIGLVKPTHGELSFDQTPWQEVDWEAVRHRVTYVPQEGYIAQDRSIGWHLGLLVADVTPERMQTALEAVGLWEILRARASRRRVSPLEILAADLSGGERKRLHLARALLGDSDLVILDEAEAALDAAGRGWLKELMQEFATERRVLVIAHDESVIPDSFLRATCEARILEPRHTKPSDSERQSGHDLALP